MTNESNPMYMPVAPAYGNGGFGGFGDNGWWIILLLLCGWGGMGFGGMGGWGGMNLSYDFPWLLQGQNGINANTNAGFDRAAIQGAIGDLGSAVSGISQQLNSNEIASLNRSFDAQTAVMTGFNSVQGQLAQCCCDNRLATVQTQNVVATEAAATRSTIQSAVQTVLDKMCQQELDAYRRENESLRTQVNMQNLAASQAAQTAALIADNTAQTQYIVNRVAPYPIPAYTVANPITPAAI